MGLHRLIDLQPDMVACGESENIPDALAKISGLHPDVATVDLELGSECGLELIRRIRALGSTLRILVVSSHEEAAVVEAAAAAGAAAGCPVSKALAGVEITHTATLA